MLNSNNTAWPKNKFPTLKHPYAQYPSADPVPMADILLQLINTFVGAGPLALDNEGNLLQGANGNTLFTPPFSSFLDNQNNANNQDVKASLNYLLFDEQFKPSQSGYLPVDGSSHDLQVLVQSLTVNKNGYLYLWVSNSSSVDVFFDGLVATHRTGPLLEENHYYPYGLPMKGISDNAPGRLVNKKKCNGYEENNDLDLNLYESFYRSHDPQIGRFLQIDPKPSDGEGLYVAIGGNPVLKNDLLGDTSVIGAGGNQCYEIDNALNSLEFYQEKTYMVGQTGAIAPVKAGQLRSFSNFLGRFSARWGTGDSGIPSFIGYKNDNGKTLDQAVNDLTSSYKLCLFKFGLEMQASAEKNPMDFNLNIATSLLTMSVMGAVEPVASSRGRNPSLTFKEEVFPLMTVERAKSAPSFIVSRGGTVFPVPEGVSGPLPVQNGKGFQFIGGSGGNGLSSRVADFRFMDPITNWKFEFPGGYGSYLNKSGQTVNPITGKTISKSDWWWHIPAK